MSRPVGPLTGDAWLLFVTRFIRLFAYGALSVVLVLYLVAIGINEANVGLLLTATLIGDTVVSLALSTRADRVGRRRVLILGALLMAAAGLVFASTHLWWLLLLAGIVGIISPSGHEVGPFLPIEQAALAQVVDDRRRTHVFAWYTLTGSIATALGSLAGGTIVQTLQATVDGPRRCLSIGRAPVRRARRAPGARLRPLVARPGTAAGASGRPSGSRGCAIRRSSLAHDRVEPVRALRPGLVRRRIRRAGLHRVLVSSAVRPRPRSPGRCCSSPPTSWPAVPHCWPPGSRRASA